MVGITSRASSDPPARVPNAAQPLLLHVLPTFGVGGVQVRTAEIVNHLGNAYRHAIIALNGNHSCQSHLSGNAEVEFLPVPIKRKQTVNAVSAARAQLRRIRPDLLLTYNWGSTEWAFANMLRPLCPHLHFEDGFGSDEADRQLRRRVWFRRAALARTEQIIVPSHTLAQIATRVWKLSPDKVTHIPNGVDCSRFTEQPDVNADFDFSRRGSELIVGTVAPLRPEKNLGLLLDAVAKISDRFDIRLLIVGDGQERGTLMRRAETLGIADRIEFTGHIEAVEKALAVFDVFALTSRTEQMPFGVLQAMAAGKPIAAFDVGDVKSMLSPENRPFVTPKDDLPGFRQSLSRLLEDTAARNRIGTRNRGHVQKHYPHDRMLEAYRKLFETIMSGREIGDRKTAPLVRRPERESRTFSDV